MRQYRNKVIHTHTGTCPVTFGEQEQQEPVSPANQKEQHAPDGVLIRSSCLLLRKKYGKEAAPPTRHYLNYTTQHRDGHRLNIKATIHTHTHTPPPKVFT